MRDAYSYARKKKTKIKLKKYTYNIIMYNKIFIFTQNDICEAVYLFLTDNKDLMKYMSHCVKTYTYDFLLDGWTTDKCHISICRSENQGCFLLILPLKKIL